ncbi:MAG: hypothetical protein U1E15_12800 [Hyphomicrobiales bacterium]
MPILERAARAFVGSVKQNLSQALFDVELGMLGHEENGFRGPQDEARDFLIIQILLRQLADEAGILAQFCQQLPRGMLSHLAVLL